MKEKIISTDSKEVIEWRRKQEEIRQEKEAQKEATINQLKQHLQVGEITKEEFHLGELQAFIEEAS